MDVADLGKDWADWVGPLQAVFPNTRIPDIYPRNVLGEALIRRTALAHDLTPAEVREIIEDLVLHDIAQKPGSEAA